MPPTSSPTCSPRRPIRVAPGLRAAGLVVLPALAACAAHEQTAIGFGAAYWGESNVRVAREEIAVWGLVPGPLIVFDSAGASEAPDVEVARALAMVATPGLVAVVGHGGSRGSLATAPIYNEAGVVQIVPTGTSRLLQSAGDWTLTLAPNDSVEAEFMARFIRERFGPARVTLFYESDEYGRGLHQALAAALAPRGATLVTAVPYSIRNDMDAVVRLAARRGQPDIVIIAGRTPEAASLARASRRAFGPRPIVCADGVEIGDELRALAGPAFDDIYGVAFWHPGRPDSVSTAFVRRFERLNRSAPRGAHAMRHDALMVAARAVSEVGPDPAAVRAWLLSLGRDRPAYHGVTGEVMFGGRTGPLVIVSARTDSVVMEQR